MTVSQLQVINEQNKGSDDIKYYNCLKVRLKDTKRQDSSKQEEISNKLLQQAKESKEITYNQKYEDNIKLHFMKAVGNEGIEYINHEVLEKQRNVLSYMLKTMGTNLLNGKSIMNVSLPIGLFDARSTMETYAYNNKLAPNFMPKAIESSNLERMKLFTAYMVSTLPLGLSGSKPFNPILGETFQCKIGESLLYYEQTSHHPPVFNYYIKNPDYMAYGHSEMEVISTGNSIRGENKSKLMWKTNDGNLYQLHVPTFHMTGLMMGNRYINFIGSMAVEDKVFKT
jgi:hypothetical protein